MDLIQNFNSNEPHFRLYDSVVASLEKLLTPTEFKFTICLSQNISSTDNIIRESQDPNSKPLSIKELSKQHNYPYDYTRKIMVALKKKGIIEKHKTKDIIPEYNGRYGTVYIVNPGIISKD